ncbi:50S ribosomal protein L23 [Patescibacteria group bacterium]|nr:50S ribosomal protein L23 [Patescibacteria group bacterium]
MAIFGNKKAETKKAAPQKKAAAKTVAAPAEKKVAKVVAVLGVKDVLVRPRITEKAANMTVNHVYTFDIRKNATKKDVADAVKKLYKVDPIKVTTVNTPAKRVRMRTKRGFGKSSAGRKAYVTLKKGQEIQFS